MHLERMRSHRYMIMHAPSSHTPAVRFPWPQGITAAPSYDELCLQIRDVQKQYTCGTSKEKALLASTQVGPAAERWHAPAAAP